MRISQLQIPPPYFISQLVTVCPYIAQHGTDTFFFTIRGDYQITPVDADGFRKNYGKGLSHLYHTPPLRLPTRD